MDCPLGFLMRQIVDRSIFKAYINSLLRLCLGNMQYLGNGRHAETQNPCATILRLISEKIALFMSNCVVHVKNSQLCSSEYLEYFQVIDRNLDRKEGFTRLSKTVYCRKTVKNKFYRTYAYYNFAGWEVRFKCKCIEAWSVPTKTAKNWHANKTVLRWAGHCYVAVRS